MKTLPAPADIPADRPTPYFASQPAPLVVWERAVRDEAALRGLLPAA